jgi:hypothetical protein
LQSGHGLVLSSGVMMFRADRNNHPIRRETVDREGGCSP